MEELFRFINVSCETSRFYLRNFSFMFGRGELIAISSDTTSAKDALVSSITISDIHTNHIHSLSMNLQPGEITYLVGKG